MDINTSIIFTLNPLFLMTPHLPLVPTPEKDLFFPLALHFFKCILIDQGSFALVLLACIYYVLIKLTSSPHYLLILYHHAPLIFKSLPYSALYYIHI
jgi:hypothetical protein